MNAPEFQNCEVSVPTQDDKLISFRESENRNSIPPSPGSDTTLVLHPDIHLKCED